MKWWNILKIEPKDNPLSDEFQPPEIPEKVLMSFKERIIKDLKPVLDKVIDGEGKPMLSLEFHEKMLEGSDFSVKELKFNLPSISLVLDKERFVKMMFLHKNRKRRTELTPFNNLLETIEYAYHRAGEYMEDMTALPILNDVRYFHNKFEHDIQYALENMNLTLGDVIAQGEVKSVITGHQKLDLFDRLSPATYSILERLLKQAGKNLQGYLTSYDMPLEELLEEVEGAGEFSDMLTNYHRGENKDYYELWDEYDAEFELDEREEREGLVENRLEENLRRRRNRG